MFSLQISCNLLSFLFNFFKISHMQPTSAASNSRQNLLEEKLRHELEAFFQQGLVRAILFVTKNCLLKYNALNEEIQKRKDNLYLLQKKLMLSKHFPSINPSNFNPNELQLIAKITREVSIAFQNSSQKEPLASSANLPQKKE